MLACATSSEERAARGAGARASRVGLAAVLGVPEGRLVSFGLAGALRDDLAPGTVLDAVRVVDGDGRPLWEGEPLGVPGARPATLVAAGALVDGAAERLALARRSGADAVDLESGVLARSGRLAGCVRVVSDTPAQPLGPLAGAVRPDGGVRWTGLARAFLRAPRSAARAAANARRALREAERAAGALA